MASLRRTLSSAYYDDSYQNGGSQFVIPLQSQKLLSSEKISSPSFLPIGAGVRRFIDSMFPQKYARKGQQSVVKRYIFRCLLFFVLGFVFGMTLFRVDDVRNYDINLEFNPSLPVNVKLDHDFAVNRPIFVVETVNLSSHILSNIPERIDLVPRKQLIVVTPTYNKALQAYSLNRRAQVLRLVPSPLLWIVVEMNSASMETADILRNTGVMYRHLVCTKNLTNVKNIGVHQRNIALEHIEHHKLDGIVYFANEDNIDTLDLFDRLRKISRFGTWPVAKLAQGKSKAILEGPVCNGSQVIGWHANERSKKARRFYVDMSGFAFNSTILWDPKRWRRPTSNSIRQLDTLKDGFLESIYIEQLVEDESQMESITPGCSSVMNWHLSWEARDLFYPRGWMLQKNLDAVLPV